MFKYEEEIKKRIEEFNWEDIYQIIAQSYEETGAQETGIELIYLSFKAPLSQYAKKTLERDYTYDKYGIHKKEKNYLPVMKMPVADYSELPHQKGVYFIGMIGINPQGQKYYLVKVGCASDIHKRVSQYAGYNPMLYIGGFVTGADKDNEAYCHKYLENRAIARAQNADEWYYVTEEMYFKLCDIFSDKMKFVDIALGKVE